MMFANRVMLAATFVLTLIPLGARAQLGNLRDLDPTNRNSRLREGLKDLDPTNKNSAIRNPRRSVQESLQSTWGEVGRGAYPAAASVMAARHARKPEQTLSPWDARALAVHFGDLVKHVRIVWGAKPLDKWGTNDTFSIRLSGVDTEAQTYGSTIYVDRNPADISDYHRLSLLAHELVHVQQVSKYESLQNFGYHYFREFAEGDFRYDHNDMEKEAVLVATGTAMERIWAAFARENTHRIDIENRSDIAINIQLSINGEESIFSISPRTTQWATGVGRPPRFAVKFDSSFADGFQAKRYDLGADRRYFLHVLSSGIDLSDSPPRTEVARPNLPSGPPPRLGVQGNYLPGHGFSITSVGQGSPAAGVGLEAGDIIVEVNGMRIDSADRITQILQELAGRGQRQTQLLVDNVRERSSPASRYIKINVAF